VSAYGGDRLRHHLGFVLRSGGLPSVERRFVPVDNVVVVLRLFLVMVAGGEEANHCESYQADAHSEPDDHSSVERSPIAAISVPGIPTAVLVPVTGEVLCPVVPPCVVVLFPITHDIIFRHIPLSSLLFP